MKTKHNVLLTGSPDDVFVDSDGAVHIVDYKTAPALGSKVPLYRMYEIQLAVYAALAIHTGLGKEAKIYLVYTSPRTTTDDVENEANLLEDGFSLNFEASVFTVELKLKEIEELNSSP